MQHAQLTAPAQLDNTHWHAEPELASTTQIVQAHSDAFLCSATIDSHGVTIPPLVSLLNHLVCETLFVKDF
jgi:hypothetical protein